MNTTACAVPASSPIVTEPPSGVEPATVGAVAPRAASVPSTGGAGSAAPSTVAGSTPSVTSVPLMARVTSSTPRATTTTPMTTETRTRWRESRRVRACSSASRSARLAFWRARLSACWSVSALIGGDPLPVGVRGVGGG